MSARHLAAGHGSRTTPQSESIPGSGQVPNSAGGFAWEIDPFAKLRRFLILGTEGGSYYASERDLTKRSVDALRECLRIDPIRTLDEIVLISHEGRAPKNDYAIFALAMVAAHESADVRAKALAELPTVCRTGTHLFLFARYIEQFRGWGRQLRRAIASWYASQEPDALAYQLVKYRQREGISHRDLLRLAHPARTVSAGNPTTTKLSDEHASLFAWVSGRALPAVGTDSELVGFAGPSTDGGRRSPIELPRIVEGFERAQRSSSPKETAQLIREYDLPREAILDEHTKSAEVWDALLEKMPLGAMTRCLNRMSAAGLLVPSSQAAATVVERFADQERIRRSRLHPIQILAAMLTYKAGRGTRGSLTWAPVPQVTDALDQAFYLAFGNVESSGKRTLLALDVSGSMDGGTVAGVPGLTPRVTSAAMALVTVAVESRYEVVAFTDARQAQVAFRSPHSGRFGGYGYGIEDGLTVLPLSARQRLDDVAAQTARLPMGGTDCALPMLYASAMHREIDSFVIYTDSETWAGDVHPAQALRRYRQSSGIDARLIVVGMVANEFSIADPNDRGMLDVVGFDTNAPQLISDFAAGRI